MHNKTNTIPVNPFPMKEAFHAGIIVGKTSTHNLHSPDEAKHAHRHDSHIFAIVERGTASLEIDFEEHKIKAPSIVYIHPNQVHRIVEATHTGFYMLDISNENLNPEYLTLLEDITPTKPMLLSTDFFATVLHSVSLCMTIFERKHDILYPSLLKNCCNTLVALMISPYLELRASTDRISRFDTITKAFKLALARDFTLIKQPSDYAIAQNISRPYLNECVRNATGFSVSYHIQQRIILEAKRLLCHSNKSVKEIAYELGYEDHAYFSRLFTKVTGMTALAFRNKNID